MGGRAGVVDPILRDDGFAASYSEASDGPET